MEHTKTYQEFKKNGNTKFVRYDKRVSVGRTEKEYLYFQACQTDE